MSLLPGPPEESEDVDTNALLKYPRGHVQQCPKVTLREPHLTSLWAACLACSSPVDTKQNQVAPTSAAAPTSTTSGASAQEAQRHVRRCQRVPAGWKTTYTRREWGGGHLPPRGWGSSDKKAGHKHPGVRPTTGTSKHPRREWAQKPRTSVVFTPASLRVLK